MPTIDQTGLNNFDEEITKEKAEETMLPPEVLSKIEKSEDEFKNFGFSESEVGQKQ